jgi:glutamate-1-semialdehyde 2,1-aminomutase
MYEVKSWVYEEVDAIIFCELQSYLPEKIFDIHAHLYQISDLGEQAELYTKGPEKATMEVWHENVGRIVGHSRLKGGLFIPPPPSSSSYIDKANAFVIKQLEKIPEAKGLILISPYWQQDKLTEYIKNKQIVGIKPFSTFSNYVPSWQSPLNTYMPEWAWEIADEYGLVILVHLVRNKALADPENYNEIIHMCTKYPKAKLLLDHAARGFHAPNTIKGVTYIKRLENVWFDLSCICEPTAILSILNVFGPKRLIWGSDFPLSQLRGKAVTVGDGFFWLSPENVNWESYKEMCKPTLIGIESLRAAKEAFDIFGLSEEDIRDVFYENALQLIRKNRT